jgi:serine phosphatase RsbU (regulator of sigma subunit)
VIKRSFIFILFIALCCNLSKAQSPQERISKLLAQLKTDKEDTNKIDHIKWLVWYYRIVGNMDTAIKLGNEGMDLAIRLNHQKSISSMHIVLGLVYWNEGDYAQALDRFFKALTICEQIKSKKGIGVCCTDIGNIYQEEGEYPKGLQYYLKGVGIDTMLHDTIGALILYSNIAGSYNELNDSARAMYYVLRSLNISKQIHYTPGIATALNDIAGQFFKREEYNKSLYYYLLGEKPCEESQEIVSIVDNAQGIGTIYLQQKKYAEAEKYFSHALSLADSVHLLRYMAECDKSLSDLYNATGQWQKAFKAFSAYAVAKDSLFNEDKNKQITSKALNYEFEKKEAEIKAEQDKKDTLAKAEKQRQSVITYAVSMVLLLSLILAGFMLRGYRQKQRANLVLEEKNRTILDSITYAKRLQDAILPPLNTINTHLPESFVLYKPKDIVAGDFYWMEKVGDVILIAACDCTGHGVPGAMVSVVCSNALNRALKEFKIRDTGLLLDKVREIVIETFMKSGGEVKDGMDCSFCAINTKTNEIEWSGAYNPLWYIANGEMKEITADKQPIGKSDNTKVFTTHRLSMQKGDMLYLFTDGYADQFGGPKGKKFKYRQLQQLIVANAKLKMEEQKKVLENTLESWKGNLEQVDDILVIGIRI